MKNHRFFIKAIAALSAMLLILSGCTPTAPVTEPTVPTAPQHTADLGSTVIDDTYDASRHLLRNDQALSVTSPDRNTRFTISVSNGQLSYRVTRGDVTYIRTSALGITVDGVSYGAVSSMAEVGQASGVYRTDIRVIHGRTAKADAPCIEANIPVGAMTMQVRVYNNGAAFRYQLPGEGQRTLQSEQTAFTLPVDSSVWAGASHQYYETINKFYDPSRMHQTTLGTPATIELANGGYAAVLEGNLQNYPGIVLEWATKNRYRAAFLADSFVMEDTIVSPWRIISIADNLNELVNNTIVYQVCDTANGELFGGDWVKPGRAAWSWITGRTTDRVTPALMEKYTTLAARLGFEYNIIDEGWVSWSNRDGTLQGLASLGDRYAVGQILWTGVTAGASYNGGIHNLQDAKDYLDFIRSMGMAGGKIDFFTTEANIDMGVDIYKEILSYAAELELVVNFHGCNKPTGQDTTFPNELNREAILGLESTQVYNYAVQAQMFVTQPFVRNLAGHADYTPAVETAFHMAQLVLTDAPMQAIGSDPALILRSQALEMIKSVPTVWRNTVVLPQSDIGKTAVIARQGDNASWYVGGINYSGTEEMITLDLSLFLGEGTYRMELWTDDDNAFDTTVKTVTKNDTVTVPFEKLTGFIVRFDRVTLSQYGGEIQAPVTLNIADPNTTVRYTLDGSIPTEASPLWNNGEAITLADSCTLTIKIMSGADSGYTASYRFNKLS